MQNVKVHFRQMGYMFMLLILLNGCGQLDNKNTIVSSKDNLLQEDSPVTLPKEKEPEVIKPVVPEDTKIVLDYSQSLVAPLLMKEGESKAPVVDWKKEKGTFSLGGKSKDGFEIDQDTGEISWDKLPYGPYELDVTAKNSVAETKVKILIEVKFSGLFEGLLLTNGAMPNSYGLEFPLVGDELKGNRIGDKFFGTFAVSTVDNSLVISGEYKSTPNGSITKFSGKLAYSSSGSTCVNGVWAPKSENAYDNKDSFAVCLR